MRVLLAACLLTGCAAEPQGFERPPEIALAAVGDPSWAADVETASQLWAIALGGCVESPFVVDDAGHPVILVDPDSIDGASGVAHLVDGWIEVEDGPSRLIFLVHELGHVIGLGHSGVSPSVMRSTPSVEDLDSPIAPVDAAAARAALGC